MRALTVALGVTLFAGGAWAASAGRVVRAEGAAWAERTGASVPLAAGDAVLEGDVIRTDEDGRLRILLGDDSVLDIGSATKFVIKTFSQQPERRKVGITLTVGKLWARVAKLWGTGSSFEVETANAVAGVRGTSFVMETGEEEGTKVTVLGGSVTVWDLEGRWSVLERLQQGLVGADGELGVSTLSGDQVASLRDTLRLRPRLSQALTGDIQDMGSDGPGPNVLGERGPAPDLAPPLVQDPAIGLVPEGSALIRGRFDVKN